MTSPTWWPATASRTRSSKRRFGRRGLRRGTTAKTYVLGIGQGSRSILFLYGRRRLRNLCIRRPEKVLAGGRKEISNDPNAPTS